MKKYLLIAMMMGLGCLSTDASASSVEVNGDGTIVVKLTSEDVDAIVSAQKAAAEADQDQDKADKKNKKDKKDKKKKKKKKKK